MQQNAKPIYLLILSILLVLIIGYQVTNMDYLFNFTLLFIGGLLGATLNYFHFGFSSSFRSLINEQNTAGMRAIIWMLAFAILLFSPILALETIGEQSYHGFIRPLSLSVAIGAFIFGIGMQIGCGCTSGTLNRVGQLQAIALPTLLFMIVGGTLAAWTFDLWRNLPTMEAVSFQHELGWFKGLLVQAVILILLYHVLLRMEYKVHRTAEPLLLIQSRNDRLTPLLRAGLLLAFLNALLLLFSGSPWAIASAFPYWGVQLIEVFNLPIDWDFWEYSQENQARLSMGIFENPVSLTTIGVISGALFVSIFLPRDKLPLDTKWLTASVIGGLLMGYGAVLASGCNIGAFFSGIASGSLHGWMWFLFALFGNIVGLKIRNHFLL